MKINNIKEKVKKIILWLVFGLLIVTIACIIYLSNNEDSANLRTLNENEILVGTSSDMASNESVLKADIFNNFKSNLQVVKDKANTTWPIQMFACYQNFSCINLENEGVRLAKEYTQKNHGGIYELIWTHKIKSDLISKLDGVVKKLTLKKISITNFDEENATVADVYVVNVKEFNGQKLVWFIMQDTSIIGISDKVIYSFGVFEKDTNERKIILLKNLGSYTMTNRDSINNMNTSEGYEKITGTNVLRLSRGDGANEQYLVGISSENEMPIIMPVQYFKNKVLDSQVEYISKNENSETIQKCTDTVSCGITISFPVELKNKIKTFNKEGVDTTERKCYVLKGNFEFDIKFEYKNSKVNEVSCYNGND